jgi:Flp pilus assembly pilin Flp
MARLPSIGFSPHSSKKESPMANLKFLLIDESGLELSEYAVAAALVIVPLIVAIDNLGAKITEVITDLLNRFDGY